MLTCMDSYLNHTLDYRQTRTQNSSSSPLWIPHVGGKIHTQLPGLAPDWSAEKRWSCKITCHAINEVKIQIDVTFTAFISTCLAPPVGQKCYTTTCLILRAGRQEISLPSSGFSKPNVSMFYLTSMTRGSVVGPRPVMVSGTLSPSAPRW